LPTCFISSACPDAASFTVLSFEGCARGDAMPGPVPPQQQKVSLLL
jgi:hypothetical protein